MRVVLGLCLLSAINTAYAADPWIKILTGAEQQRIIDDGKEKTLPIPLTLEGVKPADVTLRTRAVRRDTVLVPELVSAFEAQSSLEGAENSAPFLQLKVRTAQALKAGSYEVWIEASATQPQNTRAEILRITIDHPVAALRVPASVPIEVVIWPWRDDVKAQALKLELTSDASRLNKPALGAIRWPQDKPVTGTVALAKALGDVT